MNNLINSDNIRLLMAMQLPLVGLIILLCFMAKLPTLIGQNDQNQSKILILRAPLKALAFALIFNFIYLLINLNRSGSLFTVQSKHFLISLLNSSTTFLLYFASLVFFYKKREEENGNANVKSILSSTFLLFIITVSIFGIDMGSVVADDQKHGWVYYIFDSCAYFSVSYFAFAWSRKSNANRPRFSGFIAFGLFLWGVLQVAAPIAEKIGAPSQTIDFFGFFISALAKISILYGLFNIYNNITNFVLAKFRTQYGQLEGKVGNLEELQVLINEVSRSGNEKTMTDAVKEHLVFKPIFDFDYMIFSKVDYLEKRITHVASAHKDKDGLEDVDKWVNSEGISIYHHDIMAVAVEGGEIIHVRANFMNGSELDLDHKYCPLNKEVYTKFNHQFLHRYFIPVLQIGTGQRKNLEEIRRDNKVVALIELGYFTMGSLPVRKAVLPNEGELNIYIDNCAQVYRRIQQQKVDEKIADKLKECDDNSSDNHKEYLNTLITEASKLVKADAGILSIFPYYVLSYDIQSSYATYNLENRIQKKIGEIFKESRVPNGSDTLYSNTLPAAEMVSKELNMKVIFGEPILHNKNIIGYVYFFSQDENYLNKDIQAVVQKMFATVSRIYIEKKFHFAVSELVIPVNTIADPSRNIQPIVQSLKTFYSTNDINVWVRSQNGEDNNNGGNIDDHAKLTTEFKEIYPQQANRKIKESKIIDLLPEYEILESEDEKGKIFNEIFSIDNKSTGFVNMLYIPLRSGQQLYGFITVQFSSKVSCYSEDIQFMKIIASRATNTLLLRQVIVSFQDISASFKLDELDVALKVITDRTMSLLDADSVILFKSEDGKQVFFSDIIISFKERAAEAGELDNWGKPDDHVELAEAIIQGKTVKFDTPESYAQYRKTRPGKKLPAKGFWERESIKASIALPLVSKAEEERSVGVLFVNYKRTVDFTDDIESILETFGTFAAGIIHTGFKFDFNKKILLSKFKMSEAAMSDQLAGNVLHDTKRAFKILTLRITKLINQTNSGTDLKTIQGGLNNMLPSINEMDKFFEQFEEYYKKEIVLKLEMVDIVELLNYEIERLEPMVNEKLITAEPLKDYNLPLIECDKFKIHRVFSNLMVNACQAMDKRGILEIKVKDQGDMISIDVIDDGEGIDKNLYDFITLPYISTRHNDPAAMGSGLGLAACKYIIEKHGGKLKYSSKRKKTVFTVTIPKKQNQTN